ncbi:S-adenosyl-L-methionine-dependent methyltransferase [Armillaria novae-zelandiae]|uniref:S-adenosyl-L-methionine-dependent methyltransferase n=1 Tax=Armillaria novae-zelandiae TaxID=153914 RepID=A0AA39NZ50_9AGAR|nr:S-adenosyl-L-methionine-dependent methyltransferase [Armillaria novae-zelandiae]
MSSQLSQIVSLITDATKFVEESFSKMIEHNVPSLDDTAPHPLDDQGACAQLCALVARPNRTMINIFEPASIRVVVNFNIADHLLNKPEGLHISDLGALSGAEPQKLVRIMRLLAKQTKQTKRHLCLKDPDWGHSYSPGHAPFNFWSKYPGSIFSWYEDSGSDIAAAKGARFGMTMKAWDESTELWAVVNAFPWDSLRQGATVCDVGGGTGVTSMQLAKEYPNLSIVLQDLPALIELAKNEIWPKSCPAAIEDGHVEFKAFDFLMESPVKGCDVYLLKNVLHNWPDKECKKILQGVGNIMSADSRLLICDYIIQHANRGKTAHKSIGARPAPEPLLPNYGAGRMTQYNMDVEMMCVCNSQERSLDHFVKLGKEAGLRFVRVWDAREASTFEFCME